MEIDTKEQKELPASSTKKEKGTGTAPSSKAPSPKPARPAKETPQLPQGSGLITNALFGMGGDDSAKSPDSRSTPNIVVHVPLSKGNQIVNFAQLAEEQYGFAALHPRLAAHKDRLARVAAAGAALERNDKGLTESAEEDLSLEADRDSDMDGDLAMGGTAPAANGAGSEAGDGKKKRRRKVEEYDRDDPFVDDSEMAWQEQAAASKDGFFVYMGPLVPEGDKVQVERLVFLHIFHFLLWNNHTNNSLQCGWNDQTRPRSWSWYWSRPILGCTPSCPYCCSCPHLPGYGSSSSGPWFQRWYFPPRTNHQKG